MHPYTSQTRSKKTRAPKHIPTTAEATHLRPPRMSSLHQLQRLLGSSDTPLLAPEDATSLKALESLYKNPQEGPLPKLLEHARIDASRGANFSDSSIHDLSLDEIEALSRRFSRYQASISAQRERLAPIESVLQAFNNDLNELSSTLSSLQDQSTKLSSDLGSQREATERLNPVILDLMVPPDVAKAIAHDPVDPAWVENIRFLSEKRALIDSFKDPKTDLAAAYSGSRALSQLELAIHLLVNKAVERIRDFIIGQIKRLRSLASLLSQNIQQTLLLVKEVYGFLRIHHPELAAQLQLAYIYTMRWYYHTKFAKYLYALQKLHLRHVDLLHVLGGGQNTDEKGLGAGLKTWLYSGSSSLHPPPTSPNPQHGASRVTYPEYLQSIDKRIEILDPRNGSLDQPHAAIPLQIAETTPFNYWLEFVYQQWLLALVDNVVVEYLFMVEFFYEGDEKFGPIDTPGDAKNSSQQPRDWATIMFEDVYSLGRDFVAWLLAQQPSLLPGRIASGTAATRSSPAATHGTCDAYAVLLVIRLVQATQSQLHNEFHIPVLDDYLTLLLMVLWPHFTKIIDLNCDLMKKVVLRTGVSKGKDAQLAPVAVTQQFAQLLLGFLKLAVHGPDKAKPDLFRGEPLFTSVTRLRNDFEGVLTKLSSHLFGSGGANSVQKEVFLYNNYFLIVSILKNENGGDANAFNEEQILHFETLCLAYKK